ncbi:Holliday junction resolvase RuvX [Vaccinium witches'-broom phytoplasma]|uniref:Holliday junction resolvase RuvX n=1 Tax=Vaccinium witches'-broom phytoplasma TaxID=85642 RepID=UPI001565289E|nr:Holliday junction resolvase RuvX [Vaccinium witches'-broom phytoplasma]
MEGLFVNNNNSFLGLDLGEKTLGIALSESGIIANNLKTINFTQHKYEELITPLKEMIEQFNIKTIILGNPKHMNNDVGIKATISMEFQEKLQNNFPLVEVILWDERLSTVQAFQAINSSKSPKVSKHKQKKHKKLKDEIAAMIILQNFLNFRFNQLLEKQQLE